MKKFGIFAFFCTLCGAAFAAASIRASSVPLSGGTTVSAPKSTVSTTATTSDSNTSDNSAQSSSNVDVNNSRISFASPLGKVNRYYVPAGTHNTTQPSQTETAETAKELAELQRQIDNLIQKQTQIETTLPTTVQTEIKNSDLTKNASFNEAISDLQDNVASIDTINQTVESKIDNKLIESGIVDNRGKLLVATTDEIQPIALAQKMESTLAVKFAKKSDFTPSKIASNIVSDNTAVSTLAGKIGTNEDTVKDLIKSDLQKRGIVDGDNKLQVAKKTELPVIDTDTVSAALQNTPAFDNMISQNLTARGIYDASNQLQLVKKSEITPEFLSAKLDSKYAKSDEITNLGNQLSLIRDGDENTSGSIAYKLKNAGFAKTTDITPESLTRKLDSFYVRPSAITSTELSNKLADVFVTPNQLAGKNYATRSELPVVNEETVSAALRNSTTLDDTIVRNLKSKRLLNDNNELNVATKSSVDTLSSNISSTINTLATKNEVAALDNRFAKTSDITADAIADKIAASDTAREKLNGKIGTDETAVKKLILSDLKTRGIVDNGNNLNVATKSSVDALSDNISSTIDTLATKNEVAALNTKFALKDEIGTNEDDVKSLISADLKKRGIIGTDDKLNVATKSSIDTLSDNISSTIDTLATKNEVAALDNKFALKDDIGTNEDDVKSLISADLKKRGIIDDTTETLKLATKDDVRVENLVEKLDDTFAKSSDLTAEKIATSIAESDAAREKLSGQLGTSEQDVTNILVAKNILKNDANKSLNLATKEDVSTLSNTVSNTIDTLATKTEVSALDSKFALKGEVGTDEAAVKALIKSDLQTRGVIDDKENLAIATDSEVSALSGTVRSLQATVDGDVNTSGSLLYRIKNNETLRTALKGTDGKDGKDGKDGTSYKLKEPVQHYTDLSALASSAEEGDGHYVLDNGKLYVYTCDTNGTCAFPTEDKGIPMKGEKGDPGDNAKPVEQTYCEENITIVSALYSDITSASDCASKFTNARYTAIMGGARAYCLSLVQKIDTIDLTAGIGKRLSKTFTAEKMTSLKGSSSTTLQQRLSLKGFGGTNKTFIEGCEEKYNEIMAGEDGDDAESAEITYCKAVAANYTDGTLNRDLARKLYPSVTIADDCTGFTSAMYSAMIGGAKAFCADFSATFNTVDLNKGAGLKMAKLYASQKGVDLSAAKTALTTLQNKTPAARLNDTNFSVLQNCIDNYNSIMNGEDAETAWHAYCVAQNENDSTKTNLEAIIQPLYGNSKTCDNFTSSEYNAIMGGAKAYCLSLAIKPAELSADSGIGKKLEKALGTGVVSNLKTNKVSAKVRLTGATQDISFVEACEEKYNEIMSGNDGEDAKSAEQVYCEAQAENYPSGTTNLTLIKQLYTSVSSCADFTPEMYNAIMGGAKAYCLSLAQNPTKLVATTGIGLKLEQALGKGIVSNLKTSKVATKVSVNGTEKNFVLACEEKYNEIMSGADGKGYTLKGTVPTYGDLPTTNNTEGDGWYVKSNGMLYVYRCDDNGTTCGYPTEDKGIPMKGDPGDNGETAWHAYCMETDSNGVSNLTKIITPLYSTVTDCDKFTSSQYNAIMGGAKAYCLSLVQKIDTIDLTAGIGQKLTRTFGATKMQDLKSINTVQGRLAMTGFKASEKKTNTTFMDACEARYNEIMSGTSAEYAYCTAQAANYPDGTTNLTLIQKLYPEKNITSCDEFTADMYAAVTGGADAFCASLNATFDTVSLDDGIGLKMAKLYVAKNSGKTLAEAKTALTDLKTNKTATARLDSKIFGGKTLVQTCIDNYNEIMAGEDAETAWHAYCVAQNENDSTQTNLTAIIQPLYGTSVTCDTFTSAQYNAIQGGAKAYCLSLAAKPAELSADSGIGKKLEKALGTGVVSNLKTNKVSAKVRLTGATKDISFVEACEEKYNEIMAGDKGDKGDDGDDGESAASVWCRAHVVATGFRTIDTVKKMSAAKTLNAFTARGNVATGLTKSNNEGYFTSMEACLAAVEADPTLMGGETAEEAQYNSDVKKGDVTFAISTTGRTTFDNRKSQFASLIKGKDGADGATFTPAFDETTGKISWSSSKSGVSAPAAMKVAKTDSELGTLVAGKISADTTISGLKTTVQKLDGADTVEGSVAYRLKNSGFTKSSDVNDLIVADLQTRGIVSNDSNATPLFATKTDVSTETLTSKLNGTFAGKSTVDTLSSTVSKLDGDENTTGSIANKIKTARSSIESGIDTKLAGYATTGAVSDLTTRTSTLESNALTAGNLSTQLSAENSAVKKAFADAGFAKTSDVVTKTALASELQTELNKSDSGVKTALASAGFAKTSDVVTKTSLASELQTELNKSDSSVKTALASAGFAKTADLSTAMTNAGFAKTTDVVSSKDFATKLQSSLANDNVKSALSSAGFATKDDTNSAVVTMADLSKLLNGGLVVDSSGKVKLDSSETNTNANAISSKLTTAKTKDASIQTSGIRASSNIATSVANIAATAATANAAANEDVVLDENKCKETFYMFWNTVKNECQACPDDTYFNENSMKDTSLARCICKEPTQKFTIVSGEYKCIDAAEENDCLKEPSTYWNGSKCNQCPEGTYFNEESMNNTSLPRCICENKAATFNATTGVCTVATNSAECAQKHMAWSPYENACVECPENAPYNTTSRTCTCNDTTLNFDVHNKACVYCDEGTMFSSTEGKCVEASQEVCATNPQYFWWTEKDMCEKCPEHAPYMATAGGCACAEEGLHFNPTKATCEPCPEGSEYNVHYRKCICADDTQHIDIEKWICE